MKLNMNQKESNIIYEEEEYKKIPLNKANILELLKTAHKKASKSGLIGIILTTIGGLLTDKKYNIKKVSKKPALLLSLIYGLRFTPLFAYSHSFTFSILSEILPIITKLPLLTSDIIAGLITGFTVMVDTPKQQSFVALWSLSNLAQAGCIALHKKNILRVPYGTQLIYSSFVAQLFYSLLYYPLSLPIPDLKILKALIPFGSLKSLFAKSDEGDFDPTLFEIIASNKSSEQFDSLCSHAHSQDITCVNNSFETGVHFAKENFAYFFAISVLPALLLDFKSFKKRPLAIASPKLMNLARTLGTILLTSALLNYQVCKSNWLQSTRQNPNSTRHLSIIQGFLTGLSVSWIPNNKRLIYFNSILGMSAITSLFNILRKKKLIFKLPYFMPICYSVCYSLLLTLMRHIPSVLSPTMLFGLKSFFLKDRILKPTNSGDVNDSTNYNKID